MKKHLICTVALGACVVITGCSTFNPNEPEYIDITERVAFNGENLAGWQPPHGNWRVVGGARLNPDDPKSFVYEHGFDVLVNGTNGPTSNLVSSWHHGDVQARIEFNVPEGSNSGVYFMGRYEVQVFDSWKVEKVKFSDAGGIYERWVDDKGFEGSAPSVNASKKPGEWQTLDVLFRAPRFDEFGKKTENARFISVKLNGVEIQKDVEVSGPTRAAFYSDSEESYGPLMLQGDHGPVAYRNLFLRHINLY